MDGQTRAYGRTDTDEKTRLKRGKTGDDEIAMCGVPYHALENYLNKLLEGGFKVAICDQLETPEEAKKRAIQIGYCEIKVYHLTDTNQIPALENQSEQDN